MELKKSRHILNTYYELKIVLKNYYYFCILGSRHSLTKILTVLDRHIVIIIFFCLFGVETILNKKLILNARDLLFEVVIHKKAQLFGLASGCYPLR